MPKKPKISQADIELFRDAVKGTTPLTHGKVRLKPAAKKQRPLRPAFREEDEPLSLNEKGDVHLVAGDEFIAHKQASISNKTLHKLRRGQFHVDASLDLHGLSVEEAREAVDVFIRQCLDANCRVVLIVHGKGRGGQVPILKNKLNHWLRNINVVLAFCSATTSHGSRGAIYVLLKRTQLGDENE